MEKRLRTSDFERDQGFFGETSHMKFETTAPKPPATMTESGQNDDVITLSR